MLFSEALPSQAIQPQELPHPAYYIRSWHTEDGLPDDNVTAIVQTRDGYLWVTTQSGMVRFDGIRFQEVLKSSSDRRRNPTFQAAAVDDTGKMWLVGDNGAVSWLETGGTNIANVTKGRLLARVQSIVLAPNDGVWVSYGPRIPNVLRIQGSDVTNYHGATVFPGSGHCTLARDVSGQIWFAQRNCVGVFRNGRFLKLLDLPAAPTRICSAREGGVWISQGNQVLRFQENQAPELKTALGSHSDMEATAMLEDRAGRLWLGSSRGELFCLEGTNSQVVATAQPEIVSLAEDWEENIWMGTLGGGLQRIRPIIAEVKGLASGLPSPALLSVCEDTAGSLWVTTQSGLLARQNGGSWAVLSTNADWPGGQARCIVADTNGGVWIGTRDGGLHHWQNGTYTTLRTEDGLASDTVRSLLVSAKGDLWIGTEENSGVQRLHNGQLRTYKTPAGMQAVRAMAEDAAGNIWMANARGELLRTGKSALADKTKHTLPTPRPIRCLAATPGHTLWIGYGGAGLGRLKDGEFTHLNTTQGLQDDYIFQIVPDGHGDLWLVGRTALFRVSQAQVEAVLDGTQDRVRCTVLGRDDGLREVQMPDLVFPAAIRSRNGRLYFPTRNGLVVVHPEKEIRPNLRPPPVLVERVALDGRTVAAYSGRSVDEISEAIVDLRKPGIALHVPSAYHKLEVEFTAVSFVAPQNVQFRCRLAGVDPDWVAIGTDRRITYPRVPPGRYSFQVTACNSDGVWNEAGTGFAFVVPPLIWQTWWFRLLAAAILVAVPIWLIRRYEQRKIRQRMELLERQYAIERERTRIARDIHDELGGALTQISLLADLGHAAPALATQARQHFLQIASGARSAVSALDEIVWAVNPRNDNLTRLADYLAHMASDLFEAASIRCRTQVPTSLPPVPIHAEMRHDIALAVKEAFTNVLKHSKARTVLLRLTWESPLLTVAVEDDGVGFDLTALPAGGNGLHNLATRLREAGGSAEIKSTPGHGTQVQFRVPLPGRPDSSLPLSPQHENIIQR